MKKINKYILILIVLIPILVACEDQTTPEALVTQGPVEMPESYYEALRAYKESDHQVAFGWFGGWNTESASMAYRLASIPDSVDIVSIWGQYWGLSTSQIADKEYVQAKLGTKVTFTIFAHEVPEPFEATDEGMLVYAKALADTMYKYNYNGLDLDYEPGFGGVGPLVGPQYLYPNYKALMESFVRALSKYFGPKSGTGKLLLIDGVPYALNPGLAELFDYGIVQSYYSTGDSDLQNRFNNALNNGWKAKQYIFTEDFEAAWSTGGTTNYKHTTEDGTMITVNSLKGMALFQPTVEGVKETKGGAGTYHMENEYKHDPDYKYLREAIQIMNPAKK